MSSLLERLTKLTPAERAAVRAVLDGQTPKTGELVTTRETGGSGLSVTRERANTEAKIDPATEPATK